MLAYVEGKEESQGRVKGEKRDHREGEEKSRR